MMRRKTRPLPRPLSLPLTLSHGKGVPFIVIALLIGAPFFATQFAHIFPQSASWGLYAYLGVCILVIATLFKNSAPHELVITAQEITVTPLPFLGFAHGRKSFRGINEFSHLELLSARRKNGVRYWAVFRSKPSEGTVEDARKDLSFDFPFGTNPRDFTNQLGALLKLKVVDHA